MRILRFFVVFFRVGHEQVLYRGCLPHWKQGKSGSQLLLFFSEVISRKFHVSEQTEIDPRISSLHFKETEIAINISGRKNFPSGWYLTIFDPTKARNTTSAYSKRHDNQEALY